MRKETITRNIYTFEELSEKAKDKARDWWRTSAAYDEWWEFIYDDAKEIGLKITGFDCGRGNDITGEFTLSACEVAANIIKNHGEQCETRKTAESFLKEHDPVFSDYLNEESERYETREAEEELQDIEEDFRKSLLEDYLIMLRNEHEYYFSEEHVDECIEINQYEFTEGGKIA